MEDKYYNKFGYIPFKLEDSEVTMNGIQIKHTRRYGSLHHAKSLINNKWFLYSMKTEFIMHDEDANTRLIHMSSFITAMDLKFTNGKFKIKLAPYNPSGMIAVFPKMFKKNKNLFIPQSSDLTNYRVGLGRQNDFIMKYILYNKLNEVKYTYLDKEYYFVHQSKIDAVIEVEDGNKIVDRFEVDKDYGVDKTVYGL